MKSIGFWLLALPAVLLGCSSTPRALEMEHRAILAQDQAWASAAAAKDVERTVAYWADDATLMPPDMPPLKGKDEIRQYVVAGFKMAGFSVAWDARDVVVAPGGKMAYEIGTNRFTIADSTGTLRTSTGKAVTVWRKDPGGWRCVVDIWNSAPPAK